MRLKCSASLEATSRIALDQGKEKQNFAWHFLHESIQARDRRAELRRSLARSIRSPARAFKACSILVRNTDCDANPPKKPATGIERAKLDRISPTQLAVRHRSRAAVTGNIRKTMSNRSPIDAPPIAPPAATSGAAFTASSDASDQNDRNVASEDSIFHTAFTERDQRDERDRRRRDSSAEQIVAPNLAPIPIHKSCFTERQIARRRALVSFILHTLGPASARAANHESASRHS